MNSFVELLQSLPGILGPVLSTAFGLIALDVGLGVAVALRKGVFDWQKVIAFYRTNVFPFGLAAIVIAGAAQFISADALPAELASPIADLGTLIGVAPMFAYLVLGSIMPNVRALVLGKFKWEIRYPAIAGAVSLESGVYEESPSAPAPTPDEVLEKIDASDELSGGFRRGTPQDAPQPGDADYNLPTDD